MAVIILAVVLTISPVLTISDATFREPGLVLFILWVLALVLVLVAYRSIGI